MFKAIKSNIPNFITALNLFSGSISILYASQGHLNTAAFLILVAAVFDFSDGFSARLLKAYSEFGKQLDSLADMVSFGIAPAMLMYGLLLQAFENRFPEITFSSLQPLSLQQCILFSAFIPAVFSGLRLAEFNISTNQEHSFIGLPTPAAAIFMVSCALIPDYSSSVFLNKAVLNPYILLTITLLLSILLVAPIPMFSLKFKQFGFKGNEIRYFLLAASSALILTLGIAGINLAIILYILLSLIQNLHGKK